MKKVKRIVKKILEPRIDVHASLVNRNREFIGRMPLLTVEEFSKLLRIIIPRELKKDAKREVNQIAFFDVVLQKSTDFSKKESKKLSLKTHVASEKIYEATKRQISNFKNRYNNSDIDHKTDKQLFAIAIEWFYLYLPLGFTLRDFWDFKLYEKSIEASFHIIERQKVRKLEKLAKEGLKEGKILAIRRNRVFTVEEICHMLKIEIPERYKSNKTQWITETSLFTTLENYKDMFKKMEIRNDLKASYYEKLNKGKKSVKQFVERYRSSVLMPNDDIDLFEKFVEFLYIHFPMGFRSSEYFDFKLYMKSIAEAKTYVTGSTYNNKIINACNKNARHYCRDKIIFNQIAKKYVNRDYLDGRTCSFEDFSEFVKKHPRFFVKPINANQGRGAEILEVKGNMRELFEYCQKNELLIEEVLRQHPDIDAFSSTINTVRIMTLLPLNNETIVTHAGIRIGRAGQLVDNVSAGGIVVLIDLETGKMISNARGMNDIELTNHPDSGLKFKGFQMPHWNKIMEAVKETAKLFPEVRNIGWDVTVTPEGDIEFVEANDQPSFLCQFLEERTGYYYLYEEPINEIIAWRKEKEVAKLTS